MSPQPTTAPTSTTEPAPRHHVRTGVVLLLTADTGGGHRASAEALRQSLAANVVVADPMTGPAAPRFLRTIGRLYGPLVRYVPWLWGLLFHACNAGPVHRALTALVTAALRRPLHDALRKHQPDVVVVFHPLLVAPAAAARGSRTDVKLVTVVTDLGNPHRSWWHPEVDHVVVPREGLSRFNPREHRFGLLVRREFSEPAPGRQRERLGLVPGRFVVLVSGGGEGARGTERWARALVTGPADVDVVVICGRNERLRATLSRLRPRPGRRLVVKGFVDHIADWMAAADLLVTKAGPGVIAEAAALGLPVLLAGHLPGQEEGNSAAVVRAGSGFEAGSTRELVTRVDELRKDPELLRRLRTNASQSGRPKAAARTAGLIHQLLEQNR